MGCVVGNALIFLSNIGFCQSLLELVLDKNTMLMTEAVVVFRYAEMIYPEESLSATCCWQQYLCSSVCWFCNSKKCHAM